MGYTQHSHDLLMRHINPHQEQRILTLGDQIVYFGSQYGEYVVPYYKQRFPKLKHDCIDIKPEKYADTMDLREPLKFKHAFDVITDFGTTEHVVTGKFSHGLYLAHKHIHDACQIGGLMVHENPKTNNWPGHGEWYKTEQFYHELCDDMNYELLEIGEHPAMNNTKNGWNIYAVMRKTEDTKFVSLDKFKKYTFKTS